MEATRGVIETIEEMQAAGISIFSIAGFKMLFAGAKQKMEPRLKSNPILNPPTDQTKKLTDGTN